METERDIEHNRPDRVRAQRTAVIINFIRAKPDEDRARAFHKFFWRWGMRYTTFCELWETAKNVIKEEEVKL